MPSVSTGRRNAPKPKSEHVQEHRDQEHAEHAGRFKIQLPPVPLPHPQVRMPGGLPGNVLWLGGLTAVAVLGVVDWPVAALVAAGTWVAEQHVKQSRRAQPTRT
jgi:hypothetical protein